MIYTTSFSSILSIFCWSVWALGDPKRQKRYSLSCRFGRGGCRKGMQQPKWSVLMVHSSAPAFSNASRWFLKTPPMSGGAGSISIQNFFLPDLLGKPGILLESLGREGWLWLFVSWQPFPMGTRGTRGRSCFHRLRGGRPES